MCIIPIPSTPSRISRASERPLRTPRGRSTCDVSPVIIILVFVPILVMNIFIWADVVFWASSSMTTASLKVRPLMNAKGAICTTFCSIISRSFWAGIISSRASYSGCRYGSILSLISPGRKPSFSPASTAGRESIIFRISLFFSERTANAMLMYVLPVPAGPVAKIISFSW